MSRQLYFTLNPSDWVAFIYNAGSNLHRGLDEAHSIATLHYLLRNDMMQDAQSWYRNWRHHIPRTELSHDQLMQLDDDYRIQYQAKQQVMSMLDGEHVGTLLVTLLGKMAGVTEREPEAELNHKPRAKATVG